MRPTFSGAVSRRITDINTLLCVGIDPLPAALPAAFQAAPGAPQKAAVLAYAKVLVDQTASVAIAFKPQHAHFAALGAEDELAALIGYIHDQHPGIPVILDAKRGDIGSTAALYAQEAFARYDADAVTLSPFLGEESIAPFLEWEGRGVIVLCRTSNADSDWLQQGPGEEAAFRKIARTFGELGRSNPNIGLVVGATQPNELAEVRRLAPQVLLLVPGIGAQGGDLGQVLTLGQQPGGGGLLLNVSRGISQAWTDVEGSVEGDVEGASSLARAAQQFAIQMVPGAPG